MSDVLLDSPAGALIKTTLVDFPGRVASTIFLEGCNLRCPYCYNVSLVLGSFANTSGMAPDSSAAKSDATPSPANKKLNGRDYDCSTLREVIDHLEKRRAVLTGLVISGGEPLLNPRTPLLIKEARKLGYKIKLDTNGTLPDRLQQFCEDDELRPDYIAMDLKTAPSKCALLASNAARKDPAVGEELAESIARSAKIVASFPSESREWRTVLVPPLVDEKDIAEMAKLLPSNAHWYFAQFRNENCIDPSYNKIDPYLDRDLKRLVDFAKSLIPGAELR
jgi:pyruvate formate lyase activating enzyme